MHTPRKFLLYEFGNANIAYLPMAHQDSRL